MDELQLITGCKRGESWARKELYELHAPAMMSVCMRYVNDRETAKDLMQDGFVKVFTKIHTYSGTGSFNGWMRRVFVTTALEYLRRNDILRVTSDINEYDEAMESGDVSALEQLSVNEILACVAKLPNGYRTVFNLFVIEGYSHSEIADMLGINESTSRSQFIRARKILQKNVESLIMHENAGERKKI